MHTSTRLQSSDFQFWQSRQGQRIFANFDDFCPSYHELDRVGVVSPCLEDGVRHTACGLLALTTAFYDRQRARAIDFFDYPQHFAFVGADPTNVYTQRASLPLTTPKLWDAWSWLDVWPDNKWITVPPTASAMLKQIFDYQINRLFWPADFKPKAVEKPLPGYLARMLKTRLKTVYYYPRTSLATGTSQCQAIEITPNTTVTTLVQESIDQLPTALAFAWEPSIPSMERYQAIGVKDFLNEMQSCFTGLPSL